MTKMASSPERNTFQKEKYLERQAEGGKTPENDEDTRAMVEYYNLWNTNKSEKEADPDWRENNMEYDLRSTEWIVEKVKADEAYAQNLYAAMCNNDFIRNELWPLLRQDPEQDYWHCSWRYAGGIVADMRGKGDYIDWYCSGIRDHGYGDSEEKELQEEELTDEQRQHRDMINRFVSESVITDEIRADLKKLGWIVIDNVDDSI